MGAVISKLMYASVVFQLQRCFSCTLLDNGITRRFCHYCGWCKWSICTSLLSPMFVCSLEATSVHLSSCYLRCFSSNSHTNGRKPLEVDISVIFLESYRKMVLPVGKAISYSIFSQTSQFFWATGAKFQLNMFVMVLQQMYSAGHSEQKCSTTGFMYFFMASRNRIWTKSDCEKVLFGSHMYELNTRECLSYTSAIVHICARQSVRNVLQAPNH